MLNSSNLAFWCFDLKLFLKKRKKKLQIPVFQKFHLFSNLKILQFLVSMNSKESFLGIQNASANRLHHEFSSSKCHTLLA